MMTDRHNVNSNGYLLISDHPYLRLLETTAFLQCNNECIEIAAARAEEIVRILLQEIVSFEMNRLFKIFEEDLFAEKAVARRFGTRKLVVVMIMIVDHHHSNTSDEKHPRIHAQQKHLAIWAFELVMDLLGETETACFETTPPKNSAPEKRLQVAKGNNSFERKGLCNEIVLATCFGIPELQLMIADQHPNSFVENHLKSLDLLTHRSVLVLLAAITKAFANLESAVYLNTLAAEKDSKTLVL